MIYLFHLISNCSQGNENSAYMQKDSYWMRQKQSTPVNSLISLFS